MSRAALRTGWYRFTTTFRGRVGSYLALALLIGLLGGLAMGAIAGARRTQSSFPNYVTSTNPSDLYGITGVLNPQLGNNDGYDSNLIRKIARLPHVTRVGSVSGINVLPLSPNGTPIDSAVFPPAGGNGLGSDNGEYFTQDRVSVTQGRMADPNRADEVVMDPGVAQALRLHVGDRLSVGIYTNAQTLLPAFGTAAVKPYRRAEVTLVGTVVQAHNLVQDDVDNSTSLAYFTPAFTRSLLGCCVNYTESGIQVSGGGAQVAVVSTEFSRLLPPGFPPAVLASDSIAKAQRAIKPESIALGAFGGIAALAVLLIAGQLIGRRLRLAADDLAILRALGAGPAMTASEGLIGILGAVVVGSLLAFGVAVGLSPLAPIGPVRPVDPTGGVSFDWTVLGFGVAILIIGLAALSLALAVRQMPHRTASRLRLVRDHGSSVTRAAANSGLPPPAVAGIRFALEPGGGRNAVPVRSAILGAALAVTVVVGAVTFGSSLRTLVSHPPLYGWNWNYVLAAGGGSGNIPESAATQLLNRDTSVRAWSSAYVANLTIDRQSVPVLGETPKAAVQPPVLSGHGLEGPDQIVLGAVTLAQLHKQVGDTVTVGTPGASTSLLHIVGTASMPTIGSTGPHLEMGTGALVPFQLISPFARNPFNDPVTGPQTIFIDLQPGVDPTRALHSLQVIAGSLSNNFNFGVAVGSVLRPAEIVNYRSMSATPAILGAALSLGAVAALALTLTASVRRRQRDLALLKTIGFTKRQVASVVAWQSTIVIGIGTIVGVPLGIALGRWLWVLFAEQIHAVPSPTVPAVVIALIALGGLVLANIVALVPGYRAARTPIALILRAE